MNNTIIAVYGRGNEGKSSTIKNIIPILQRLYTTAVVNYILQNGDVLATIDYKGFKIGIESQGDPGSRMLKNKTVEQLATKFRCHIIVCASRTGGDTVREVERVALLHNYHTIWSSSYYTPDLNRTAAYEVAAEAIVSIIDALIAGRL